MEPARITSFLVKIASRCNLDCDYCYMYHHADQGWRTMPRLLSHQDRSAFARRLRDYLAAESIPRCLVIFHGGEPLLAGIETIVDLAREIRVLAPAGSTVDFGMQTNGLLLTDAALNACAAHGISVSLSLDGPREANDRHRVSRRGRSSFAKALAALERLESKPDVFAGVIAVIDPATPPLALFEFFDAHRPPRLDFLLPDANHAAPPPRRDEEPDLYRNWLLTAFDLWFDHYPHLPVRSFEALLDAVAGLPSGTDVFGLGDVSLLTIETDGAYHDLDVLKVATEGASRLNGSVRDTPIATTADSPKLQAHRRLLQRDGLCPTCQACPEVEICGGGSVPHRFAADGFDHPTIYCREMLALISHARRRIAQTVEAAQPAGTGPATGFSFDARSFDMAETAGPMVKRLWQAAEAADVVAFAAALDAAARQDPEAARWVRELYALPPPRLSQLATDPGVAAWQKVIRQLEAGGAVHAVDGAPLAFDTSYLAHLLDRETGSGSTELTIGVTNPWLRLPFGASIIFDPDGTDLEASAEARRRTSEALGIIDAWRPELGRELRRICRAVQFVRDPSAHPDKIVSFSDNSVPGALYVSVRRGEGWIDAYDLADSLIHEHRHQKLYLLERSATLVEPSSMRVVSPWREDLRPPSGLLHAVFVFVELRRFWLDVLASGPTRLRRRAAIQIEETNARLARGVATLADCPLTPAGRALLAVLEDARHCPEAPVIVT